VARKLALLIGNDQYNDDKFTGLTVPQNDVISLKRVLERSDVGAFDQVDSLMNESRVVVEEAIAELFLNNKKPDDLLLLYFSGHGLLDVEGHLYLTLKNTRYDLPFGTALTPSFINTAMNKSRSQRKVLILDCCHSGAFERGTKGSKGLGTSAVTEQTFEVNGYGREILTSSTATQLSWQGDQVIGDTDKSLFTHYLVQGLETGEAAVNGAKDITVGQLYEYTHNQVVKIKPEMKPQRWVDKQQGALIIAQNPAPKIQPKVLPQEWLNALSDRRPYVRIGVITNALGDWLVSDDPSEVLAAQLTLKDLMEKERDYKVREVIEKFLGGTKLPDVSSDESEKTPGINRSLRAAVFSVLFIVVIAGLLFGVMSDQPKKGEAEVKAEQERQKIEADAKAKAEQEREVPEKSRANEINTLLGKAEAAFANNQLITPEQQSAYDYYLQVLVKDKQNLKVQEGLKKISDKYLGWAKSAIEYSDYTKAREYLAKAKKVLPNNKEVLALQKQISRQIEQERIKRMQGEKERESRMKTGTVFQDILKDGSKAPVMVVIPAGEFLMGSPKSEKNREKDEGPQRKVRIKKPFAIGKYEITKVQFQYFVEQTSYNTEAETGGGCYYWTGEEVEKDSKRDWRNPGFDQTDQHPVACVSWNDVKKYIAWLNKNTEGNYRLPTEAEWEYVARAKTDTPFYFGETINTDQANYDGNYTYGNGLKGEYRGETISVGSFPVNEFGIFDMHGNVWEWTEDCYHDNYKNAPIDGSAWVSGECSFRVLRGGSWFDTPWYLRSANRTGFYATYRIYDVGFRLARNL